MKISLISVKQSVLMSFVIEEHVMITPWRQHKLDTCTEGLGNIVEINIYSIKLSSKITRIPEIAQ